MIVVLPPLARIDIEYRNAIAGSGISLPGPHRILHHVNGLTHDGIGARTRYRPAGFVKTFALL